MKARVRSLFQPSTSSERLHSGVWIVMVRRPRLESPRRALLARSTKSFTSRSLAGAEADAAAGAGAALGASAGAAAREFAASRSRAAARARFTLAFYNTLAAELSTRLSPGRLK